MTVSQGDKPLPWRSSLATSGPMSESPSNERKDFIFRPDPLYTESGAGGNAMVRHIDSELQGLKDLALQMGGCVEKAFENACLTVTSRGGKAFEEVHKLSLIH